MNRLENGGVDAWLMTCENDGVKNFDDWYAVLDAKERQRCEKLIRPESAFQYTAAHWLVRSALSSYVDVNPREWQFEADAMGKPRLKESLRWPQFQFNLSHTNGLVACAVSLSAPVGVDVELMQTNGAISETSALYLSAFEQHACNALSPKQRQRRLYEYWVLKEAFAKACGLGMGMPLKAVTMRIGPHEEVDMAVAPWGGIPSILKWRLQLFQPTVSHMMAIAVGRKGEDSSKRTEVTCRIMDQEGKELMNQRPKTRDQL